MDDGQEQYIHRVLEAYRNTPCTTGTVRRPDRTLAAQLFQRGVPVSVIENAFVLAAMRRLMRPADAPPLGAIRSLAYFLPVIEKCWNCVSARTTSTISATSFNASHQLSRHPPRARLCADDGKPNRTPAAWMISPAPTRPYQRTRLRRG
jgi:hypothetical protein